MKLQHLIYSTFFCLLSFSSFSQSVINGKITDADGPVIGAAVLLYKDSVQVKAIASDLNGYYTFTVDKCGTYDIQTSALGMETKRITGILVAEISTTTVDFVLHQASNLMDEICITDYRAPLINFDQTSSVKTVNAESIANSPLKNVAALADKSSGLSSDSEGNISIRGARSNASNYYVDGIRVTDTGLSSRKNRFRKNRFKSTPHKKNINNESYKKIVENEFQSAKTNSISTLSIDVDRASYSNVRRFIQDGQLPPQDAVRVEEMINYFTYDYEVPAESYEHPFKSHTNLTQCPWDTTHQLLHIAVQGKVIKQENVPPSNLVFLIDVSGSMDSPNKLPLLKSSLKLLVKQLRKEDQVAIVVYASASGCVLESTSGQDKSTILDALEKLNAGGSTAGAAGIKQAYQIAESHFIEDGNNRVILATDGDFNVGVSSNDELLSLIKRKRESGVFLSVLGFGQGNYQDDKMQIIADAGNGNHSYIDNMSEAKKVFQEEFSSTLFTIAKDVKIQIEFNPFLVEDYRMIGYENRVLAAEDFNDDKKDAGEMGAGHSVTVIYEIIPKGSKSNWKKNIDPKKYIKTSASSDIDNYANELGTIKFRYKLPDQDKSTKQEQIISSTASSYNELSNDIKWGIQVSHFGQLLRKSKFTTSSDYKSIIEELELIEDKDQHQKEFVELVELADILGSEVADSRD